MLVSGIKSRPVYGTLSPHANASRHLLVADAEGAQAILDLAGAAPEDFLAFARRLGDQARERSTVLI